MLKRFVCQTLGNRITDYVLQVYVYIHADIYSETANRLNSNKLNAEGYTELMRNCYLVYTDEL